MDSKAIIAKFGGDYIADEHTFTMGIDRRLTTHFAERFKGITVLETCTGAGFSTIALAAAAKHVYTVEIDGTHQAQAIQNIEKAGLSEKVTFLHGSILDEALLARLPTVDAAFLDPDWSVTGPSHVYRFVNSNMQPPADIVLRRMFRETSNIAIILPPLIDPQEFRGLPEHECEKLYLGESHALYCLYFGALVRSMSETAFRAR